MKQLPSIKQYVLAYKRLKTIIPMTNNLTDMIFDDNFYLDPRAFLDEYFCFFTLHTKATLSSVGTCN